MDSTRYASVLGLGFGDCGKGRCVDALARRWSAHTVVRFCGGAQAGHHVVAPHPRGGEINHTFSQFGAGTLVPGTRTLLLDPMVVHPTALLVEAEVLGDAGFGGVLGRMVIDARCRITTPFHQAAGRLRELARAGEAHGTCGVGVGETVRHGLEHPGQVIRYGDLGIHGKCNRTDCLERLDAVRRTLLNECAPVFSDRNTPAARAELDCLRDPTLAERWLGLASALARQCPPASGERIHDLLHQPGCVLFEGAQGVLLDEWRGFHPHTTWSSTTSDAVERALEPYGIASPIEHYGVLRTYQTRHGTGPFPTEDPALDPLLPEPHNNDGGWQGRFRRGHPDAVLLDYAILACGNLTGLCVGHLDVFGRELELKWCDGYETAGGSSIGKLPHGERGDLEHQRRLTRLLSEIRPRYAECPIRSDEEFLERLSGVTALPVVMVSYGPTHTCQRPLI